MNFLFGYSRYIFKRPSPDYLPEKSPSGVSGRLKRLDEKSKEAVERKQKELVKLYKTTTLDEDAEIKEASPKDLVWPLFTNFEYRKEAYLILTLVEKYLGQNEAKELFKAINGSSPEWIKIGILRTFLAEEKVAKKLGFYYGSNYRTDEWISEHKKALGVKRGIIRWGDDKAGPFVNRKKWKEYKRGAYKRLVTGWWTVDVNGDDEFHFTHSLTAALKRKYGIMYEIGGDNGKNYDSGLRRDQAEVLSVRLNQYLREAEETTKINPDDIRIDLYKHFSSDSRYRNRWGALPYKEAMELQGIFPNIPAIHYRFMYSDKDNKIYFVSNKPADSQATKYLKAIRGYAGVKEWGCITLEETEAVAGTKEIQTKARTTKARQRQDQLKVSGKIVKTYRLLTWEDHSKEADYLDKVVGKMSPAKIDEELTKRAVESGNGTDENVFAYSKGFCAKILSKKSGRIRSKLEGSRDILRKLAEQKAKRFGKAEVKVPSKPDSLTTTFIYSDRQKAFLTPLRRELTEYVKNNTKLNPDKYKEKPGKQGQVKALLKRVVDARMNYVRSQLEMKAGMYGEFFTKPQSAEEEAAKPKFVKMIVAINPDDKITVKPKSGNISEFIKKRAQQGTVALQKDFMEHMNNRYDKSTLPWVMVSIQECANPLVFRKLLAGKDTDDTRKLKAAFKRYGFEFSRAKYGPKISLIKLRSLMGDETEYTLSSWHSVGSNIRLSDLKVEIPDGADFHPKPEMTFKISGQGGKEILYNKEVKLPLKGKTITIENGVITQGTILPEGTKFIKK